MRCPIPETGFESWLIEDHFPQREFTNNGETFGVTLTLAPPFEEAGDIGWLARLAVGKKLTEDPEHIDPKMGCQAIFDVSSPPTAQERAKLQEIYDSVK